jgi:hypothetical protein
MEEEPSLPRLSWNPAAESISHNRPHKRARLSSPPVFSSDPAVFSSDDDPSADNYTPGRRKQRYRGPWFRQQLASDSQEPQECENPKKGKRTFERQFDSGVWLGSDGTDVDEATEGFESINDTWNLSVRQSRATQTSKDESPSPEELARGQIDLCLEEGNESIDLSYVSHSNQILESDLFATDLEACQSLRMQPSDLSRRFLASHQSLRVSSLG